MEDTKKRRNSYLLCLKEFKIGAVVTAVFIAISCLTSYFMGYGRDPKTLKLVFGFPDWVFWGVLIPWFSIVLFTTIYGLFIMKGDEN
ncbi:DUF997 family protein [Maledivibacter halophilus]|uniref:DUF997 family protein n=1 Tax=Maledivibacter halophilus TaxID=36842 RepID=A0A1T5M9C1_9FIRM|nr:DUF997 family protein [Maledivibacter halophilus]SKC84428.1 Protein of unknown function [Maledivibacter halophilus]